jgi:maleylpyruvate isomerase
MLEQAVSECGDLHEPSRLPGWTRGHVITHVARNAEGLVRLLSWARTGIETAMYSSMEARAADIEAGAVRSRTEQLDDLRRTGAAFAAAAQQLSAKHWESTVRTRHGTFPAAAIPWIRAREVWLHLIDLDAGAELDVLPGEIASALVHDVAAWLHSRVAPRVELRIPDQEPVTFGCDASTSVVVTGPAPQIAGWLTGRSRGDGLSAPEGLPELPPWI